jgi:hypothetical protein
MCERTPEGLIPLDHAREAFYHSVKICALVAFTKEHGSKTEVPKGPGLRLRSFTAVALRCQNCPDPDTKENVFLHANPIQFRAFQYEKKKIRFFKVENAICEFE